MIARIKRHFVCLIDKQRARRMYGGFNYRGRVYEIKKKGAMVYLLEFKACTAYHKGEASEAWGLVLKLNPAIMRAIIEIGYDGYVAQEFIPTWPDKVLALRHAASVCDV